MQLGKKSCPLPRKHLLFPPCHVMPISIDLKFTHHTSSENLKDHKGVTPKWYAFWERKLYVSSLNLTNYIRTKALSLSEHDSVAEVLFCGSSRSNFGDLEITTNIFLEGAGEVIYLFLIYLLFVCLFVCLLVVFEIFRYSFLPSNNNWI